jgi:hypothetical protein
VREESTISREYSLHQEILAVHRDSFSYDCSRSNVRPGRGVNLFAARQRCAGAWALRPRAKFDLCRRVQRPQIITGETEADQRRNRSGLITPEAFCAAR